MFFGRDIFTVGLAGIAVNRKSVRKVAIVHGLSKFVVGDPIKKLETCIANRYVRKGQVALPMGSARGRRSKKTVLKPPTGFYLRHVGVIAMSFDAFRKGDLPCTL
jgi:hypothetical protein